MTQRTVPTINMASLSIDETLIDRDPQAASQDLIYRVGDGWQQVTEVRIVRDVHRRKAQGGDKQYRRIVPARLGACVTGADQGISTHWILVVTVPAKWLTIEQKDHVDLLRDIDEVEQAELDADEAREQAACDAFWESRRRAAGG